MNKKGFDMNCNNCIYNYLKKPCDLKEKILKENLKCGYYLKIIVNNEKKA